MFSFNKKTFSGIIAILYAVIVLFGMGGNAFAQTTTCTSPMTNVTVDASQFAIDAEQKCAEEGRTDINQCIAEMEVAYCTTANTDTTTTSTDATTTTQTPTTSNGSGNLGSDVLGITVPVVGVAVKGILYILNILVGVFISLAGFLVGWALQFNLSIFTFEPSFMMVGWTIFRDIANLGFVLGIIFIAVATILRYKNYTAKQILWKLIVAALIVNFSLVIGGVFVDISNSISSYLLNSMGSQGGSGAVAQIGDSFGFIKIVSDVSSWSVLGTLANAIGFGDGASLSMLAALSVILLFGIVFLFTLLGLAGMLLLRYFNLVFLLMISPVVWLLWIFPSTSKYFREWWTKFLHWVQFAPIMLIFLYIALSILSKWSTYQASVEQSLGTNYSFMGIFGDRGGTNKLRFGTLMVAVVACALLIGGLKMAQKMGVGGTKMALSAFDKTKGWAKKRAQRTGATLGSRAMNAKEIKVPFRKTPIKTFNKSFKETIQEKGSTKWGKAIGLGALSREATLADDKMKKTAYGDVEDIKKKYGNLSPKELQKIMDTFVTGKFSGVTGSVDAQAGLYELMAEKDALGEGKHDVDTLSSVVALLNRTGKNKIAGDLQKKLGLNDRAIKHGQDAKKGVAGAEDEMIKEMKEVIDNMSGDEYKSYTKNMGNSIAQKKSEIFGVSGNNITTKLREYSIEQGTEDSDMVRDMSASIKNDINPKTGQINPGGNHVEQYAKDAINAQLKWMDKYIADYRTSIDSYLGSPGGYDQKKADRMEADYKKMLSERQQFGGEYLNGMMSHDFSDLIDNMKKTSTSSISEMRDFARALKIS